MRNLLICSLVWAVVAVAQPPPDTVTPGPRLPRQDRRSKLPGIGFAPNTDAFSNVRLAIEHVLTSADGFQLRQRPGSSRPGPSSRPAGLTNDELSFEIYLALQALYGGPTATTSGVTFNVFTLDRALTVQFPFTLYIEDPNFIDFCTDKNGADLEFPPLPCLEMGGGLSAMRSVSVNGVAKTWAIIWTPYYRQEELQAATAKNLVAKCTSGKEITSHLAKLKRRPPQDYCLSVKNCLTSRFDLAKARFRLLFVYPIIRGVQEGYRGGNVLFYHGEDPAEVTGLPKKGLPPFPHVMVAILLFK